MARRTRRRDPGATFWFGPRVERAARVVPYERQAGDPVSRPLRIFALDPSASRLLGNVAEVRVPYEPLLPGPVGHLLEVEGTDATEGRVHVPVDLESPALMLAAGLEPTQSRPQFHMQMTYAVCSSVYQRFRMALGRTVAWGFVADEDDEGDPDDRPLRLKIRPFHRREQNAYYDPEEGALLFGYYHAERAVAGRNLPGGYVFTSLSHDIVAHECTHALLDGLRAHFTLATHPDVAAFHEGFADIVAVLHRFSHAEVVRRVLAESRGALDVPALTAIGVQFGETSGEMGPIRLVSDIAHPGENPKPYTDYEEEHERGRVLAAAIYEAFTRIFDRKKRRYLLLATGGSGVRPPDAELPSALLDLYVDLARELAGQFLNICIRALDYCPPVDIRFGDFLRAVITADYNLVPEDPYGYREAWIDAFRRRRIYPEHVPNLGEDSLLWASPERVVPRVPALSFAELAFEGDPGRPPARAELRRQAAEVGRLVTDPRFREVFGLLDPQDPDVRAAVRAVDPPTVESVRSTHRIGPNHEVVFDTVAEITQRVVRVPPGHRRPVEEYGAATVLLDPHGSVRYVIRKRLLNDARETELADFVEKGGAPFWSTDGSGDGVLRARRGIFRPLHERRLGKGR
jgi:hypothetical protein